MTDDIYDAVVFLNAYVRLRPVVKPQLANIAIIQTLLLQPYRDQEDMIA